MVFRLAFVAIAAASLVGAASINLVPCPGGTTFAADEAVSTTVRVYYV